jgi:2-methylisocitrate lyase-like PEP mutase family enzyme
MEAARKLRKLFSSEQLIVAPGAYDCITARTIQQNGYPVVYLSGAGTAAALGYPDYGLITMSEMVSNAARVAASVDVPVIADADTGFGNELNTIRAVREYERSGVAGIHIEDQAFPKKCGHLSDKAVIPSEQYISKIRAAVCAKTSSDFTIIARTDARAALGLDAAVGRVNAALAAGADMAFVEAPQTLQEVLAIPQLVRGPCMLNLVWKGRTPDLAFADIFKAGYKLVILPGLLIGAILEVCDQQLRRCLETGRQAPSGASSPQQIFARFGAEEWDRLGREAQEGASGKQPTDP